MFSMKNKSKMSKISFLAITDTVQSMQFTGPANGFNYSKQHNNAFNLHKITKIRVKSQKYGRNTGDFAKMPVYTGMPV